MGTNVSKILNFWRQTSMNFRHFRCQNLQVSVMYWNKESLFSSYWNVDVLSWYVILRALSCIEFILLLKRLLWNIQTNLQQLTWKVTKDLMIILRFCILLQEASLARVFNFWLVVLQILLIWFSKVRLETMHGFTISFPFCGLRGFY